MIKHWKRAVEFASPIALAPFFLLSTVNPGPYDWDWSWMAIPFHRMWLFVFTGVGWIVAVIALRPLSAPHLGSRVRFIFIVAIVGAWVFAFDVLETSRWDNGHGAAIGLKDTIQCYIPAALLVWGVGERLTASRPKDSTRCVHCGYSRTGLSAIAPCPECGRAPSAPSPNNLT